MLWTNSNAKIIKGARDFSLMELTRELLAQFSQISRAAAGKSGGALASLRPAQANAERTVDSIGLKVRLCTFASLNSCDVCSIAQNMQQSQS
jgi:hypothetical protein